MLSKVLSKETCAKCRFCCSFRRCSLWETPLFPKNECEKLSKDNEYGVKSDFQMQGEYGQMKLLHKYCTLLLPHYPVYNICVKASSAHTLPASENLI